MTTGIPRRWFAFAAVMIAAAFVLDALGDLTDRLDDGQPDPRPSAGEVDMVTLAAGLVDQLQIAAETGHETYRREAFGDGWSTQEAGCDTRDLVLIEESTVPAEVADDCDVLGGEWSSWFDGQTITNPGDVDVDHLVPLAEAWASGAHAWRAERRHEFANDHTPDRPDALVAVTARSNRSKGDQDPAEWLPAETEGWCRYAAAWVIQKHHWGLTADAAEHHQLTAVLADCIPEGGTR